MQRRQVLLAGTAVLALPPAFAHHGWSSFDQNAPIYLEGKAVEVMWRNPHVEAVLERAPDMKLPADLATRSVPAQSSPVDGPALLKAARLPKRNDKRWTIEFAPLTRMNAWQVAEIRVGDPLGLLGFTFAGEKGDAVLRVEYLWAAGKVYGLRSAPA